MQRIYQPRRFRPTRLAVVALAALVLAACGGGAGEQAADADADGSASSTASDRVEGGAPEGEEIVITCLCDQTGALASNGQSAREGAELAVEEINASGGVLGRPLRLSVVDDRSEPARATSLFLREVEDGNVAAAVLGGSSAVALAVLEVAEEHEIPLALANQQAVALTDPPHKYAYRITLSALRWSEELVALFESQGWERVGIFYRDDVFGQSGRDYTQVAFEGTGIEVVATEPLQPNGTDFTAQVQNLREAEPDVLLAFVFPPEGIVFANNMRTLGWSVPFIGNQAWGVPEVIAAPALDGAFYPDLIDLDREDVQEQLAKYDERFGRDGANAFNIQGWDGVHLIAAAIEEAGSAEPADITAALEEVRYETLTGTSGSYLEFGPEHHDGPFHDETTPVVFYRIEGGKPVRVDLSS